jgi:hypothetical protein
MKYLYALRVKEVGTYPPEIKCPWQKGAYVGTYHSSYGGFSLQNVFDLNDITFFKSKAEAEGILKQFKDRYPIVLEIVEWIQK